MDSANELLATMTQSIVLLLGALSKFDITKVDPNSVAGLANILAPIAQYASVILDKIIKIYM